MKDGQIEGLARKVGATDSDGSQSLLGPVL